MIKTDFDDEDFNQKIANFYFGQNFIDYFIIDNLANKAEMKKNYEENFQAKKELVEKLEHDKKWIYKDYSALLLMEFISTEIDLDSCAYNFYYKDVLNENSKLNFYKFIENMLQYKL